MNVLNIVAAKVWGGGEQYVYDICTEMQSRFDASLNNYILVNKLSYDVYRKFSQSFNVIRVNLYQMNGMLCLKDILNIIDKYKIDIINCHSGKMMPLCLIVKKLRNIKVFLFKHNVSKKKNDIYHKYMRRNVDGIICVSKLVYDEQVFGLSELEKKKYHIIYNGILPSRFDKYDNVEKTKNAFIVGYAGRIAKDKGIDVLLNSVRMLHEYHDNIILKYVGALDGSYHKFVSEYISKNKMKDYVIYGGLEQDMELFYKKIDVLVLPSKVREAFGLVLCEAMYCGVPVVTSNSGAQSEIVINNKTGFVIDDLTSERLTEVILKIYNNEINIAELCKEAKNAVENNFTIDRTVKQLIKLYSK